MLLMSTRVTSAFSIVIVSILNYHRQHRSHRQHSQPLVAPSAARYAALSNGSLKEGQFTGNKRDEGSSAGYSNPLSPGSGGEMCVKNSKEGEMSKGSG